MPNDYIVRVRQMGVAGPAWCVLQEATDEGAAINFNAQLRAMGKEDPTQGKMFTTIPTGTACTDYILFEQQRRGKAGSGLYDIREIPLYEKAA